MAFLTLVFQGAGAARAAWALARRRLPRRGGDPARGARRRVLELPSLFWLGRRRWRARAPVGWAASRSRLLVLAGYANAIVLARPVRAADLDRPRRPDFYGFGWEIQLLETGFLCDLPVPAAGRAAVPAPPAAPVVMWLLRWLAHAHHAGRRAHQAARRPLLARPHLPGLPLRDPADPQPALAAVSLPAAGVHAAGVLFNHVVELVAPLLLLGPRGARIVAGALMAALQLVLILSGNLSFLNWLTLVPIARLLRRRRCGAAAAARLARAPSGRGAGAAPSRAQGADRRRRWPSRRVLSVGRC